MPDAITMAIQKKIAKCIQQWPEKEKLSWENICLASEQFLGYEPTRQALANKPIITTAYKTRKKEIKAHREKLITVAIPKSMASAIDQIIRLTEENETLRAQLTEMAEVANRFIHNASIGGLSRAKLMSPLPQISRKTET